jgi:predicted transcriptional regulator
VEDQIITLTAQIVSAHAANNDLAADQLPSVIREVYQALATARRAPADPIKHVPSETCRHRLTRWLPVNMLRRDRNERKITDQDGR